MNGYTTKIMRDLPQAMSRHWIVRIGGLPLQDIMSLGNRYVVGTVGGRYSCMYCIMSSCAVIVIDFVGLSVCLRLCLCLSICLKWLQGGKNRVLILNKTSSVYNATDRRVMAEAIRTLFLKLDHTPSPSFSLLSHFTRYHTMLPTLTFNPQHPQPSH